MTNINENNSTTDNTQSHWGSGVKFENIKIEDYTPPPADDNAAADGAVPKKSGKFLSLLPWLFLIITAFCGIRYVSFAVFPDEEQRYDHSLEVLVNTDWRQYIAEEKTHGRNHITIGKVAGETCYKVGPVPNTILPSKYHVFDPRFVETTGYPHSIPYVYAEHWNVRRTPPVWTADRIAGFNELNLSFDNERSNPISITLMEKELERIPLRNGADMSRRVFNDCRIQSCVPEQYSTLYPELTAKQNRTIQQPGGGVSDVFYPYTLKNLNCKGSVFKDADFKKVHFKNCVFSDVFFDRGVFSNCLFDNCNFEKCRFSDTRFDNTRITGGNLNGADLGGISLNSSSADTFANAPITLEQVWSMKYYREKWPLRDKMKYPPDIQKALDEERKAAEEKQAKDAEKEK
jgi:uncharacterized protein YjbI with pentapeptide repeats